jgi:hypothetical protein
MVCYRDCACDGFAPHAFLASASRSSPMCRDCGHAERAHGGGGGDAECDDNGVVADMSTMKPWERDEHERRVREAADAAEHNRVEALRNRVRASQRTVRAHPAKCVPLLAPRALDTGECSDPHLEDAPVGRIFPCCGRELLGISNCYSAQTTGAEAVDAADSEPCADVVVSAVHARCRRCGRSVLPSDLQAVPGEPCRHHEARGVFVFGSPADPATQFRWACCKDVLASPGCKRYDRHDLA